MLDPGSVFDPEGPKFGIATKPAVSVVAPSLFGGKEVDIVMDTANPAQGQGSNTYQGHS
jgi:hypothetical protein